MSVHLGGWGPGFVCIAITLFAFTSIAGNYAYAEGALVYLRMDGVVGRTVLRCALLGMTLWGAVVQVTIVFDIADVSMGLMASINIVAILLLSGVVVRLARDYTRQRDAGRDPVFDAALVPEFSGAIEKDIWTTTGHGQGLGQSQVSAPAAKHDGVVVLGDEARPV